MLRRKRVLDESRRVQGCLRTPAARILARKDIGRWLWLAERVGRSRNFGRKFTMALLSDDKTAVFDSLPYYDNDLEQYPILKEKVDKELMRETKPPQTMHPLVPPPFGLFKVGVDISSRFREPWLHT